jgi:hypothetical protein
MKANAITTAMKIERKGRELPNPTAYGGLCDEVSCSRYQESLADMKDLAL